MWGFIWDPNYLTFRLYIGINIWLETKIFCKFWRKKYLKKLPSMQRAITKVYCISYHQLLLFLYAGREVVYTWVGWRTSLHSLASLGAPLLPRGLCSGTRAGFVTTWQTPCPAPPAGRSSQLFTELQIRSVKFNFNRCYLLYFFTKSYVWPLVRIVSTRRF